MIGAVLAICAAILVVGALDGLAARAYRRTGDGRCGRVMLACEVVYVVLMVAAYAAGRQR